MQSLVITLYMYPRTSIGTSFNIMSPTFAKLSILNVCKDGITVQHHSTSFVMGPNPFSEYMPPLLTLEGGTIQRAIYGRSRQLWFTFMMLIFKMNFDRASTLSLEKNIHMLLWILIRMNVVYNSLDIFSIWNCLSALTNFMDGNITKIKH